MAVIHRTTLVPGKLDLLTAWLPSRPWYRGMGTPTLHRAGGFRLDDPAGEVGIEFAFVADDSTGTPIVYSVPMTYRGAELPGAADGLIGRAEHGVLGPRWIYDAARDPVAVAQVLALLAGSAVAQAQSVSDTEEPSVTVAGSVALHGPAAVTDDEDCTHLAVGTASVRLIRRCAATSPPPGARATVTVPWVLPDGEAHEGPILIAR